VFLQHNTDSVHRKINKLGSLEPYRVPQIHRHMAFLNGQPSNRTLTTFLLNLLWYQPNGAEGEGRKTIGLLGSKHIYT
jgi:hypothetical protein